MITLINKDEEDKYIIYLSKYNIDLVKNKIITDNILFSDSNRIYVFSLIRNMSLSTQFLYKLVELIRRVLTNIDKCFNIDSNIPFKFVIQEGLGRFALDNDSHPIILVDTDICQNEISTNPLVLEAFFFHEFIHFFRNKIHSETMNDEILTLLGEVLYYPLQSTLVQLTVFINNVKNEATITLYGETNSGVPNSEKNYYRAWLYVLKILILNFTFNDLSTLHQELSKISFEKRQSIFKKYANQKDISHLKREISLSYIKGDEVSFNSFLFDIYKT